MSKKEYDNIVDIQKDAITGHIIEAANETDSTLDIDLLGRILQEDKVSDRLGYPFLLRDTPYGKNPDRTLAHKEKVDIRAFNDTIKTIGRDIEVLSKGVGLFERRIMNMRRTLHRIEPLFNDAKVKVDDKYKELRRQMGLVAFSFRENIQDISHFNLNTSNAYIDVEVSIIQAMKSTTFAGNISIGVLNADNLVASTPGDDPVATDGAFYHLFVPGAENKTALTVRKEERSETPVVIEASLQDLNLTANTIVLNTVHKIPTRTTVEIEHKGETKTVVKDEFLVDSVYTFTFDPMSVDRVIIYMWQKIETAIDASNLFKYDFIINNIALEYVSFSGDAEFYSQAIETDFPITDVMMEVTDQRPVGTDIKYYVSKDQERWIPITPKNIAPNAPNTIVSLALSSIEVLEAVGDDYTSWTTIAPLNTYGPVDLYNILEKSSNQLIDQGTNQLTILADPDDEIIPDSIKLYRGYDDWSIESQNYEVIDEYSGVEYRFEPYQLPSGQSGEVINPLPTDYNFDKISSLAFVRIDNEVHKIDEVNGVRRIKTNYGIYNNNISIIDPKLNKEISLRDVDEPIDYANGIVELEPTEAVIGNEVLVTYHVAIETIEAKDSVTIQIDPDTLMFQLTEDSTEDMNPAGEVFYSIYDKRIHLRRDNTLFANDIGWITVYLTFKTIRKTKDVYPVYKTYVYYGQDTEIEILPFTQEEIAAGNRHLIDNQDVSSLNTFTMVGGWHEVISTQPYKSDVTNNNDVNVLTNKHSNAGIILGEYSERRAYEFPMRQTSTYLLSNVVAPGDHRSFAFKDGFILTNFRPEELPEGALTIASHLTGSEILCKEALYLDDGKNTFKEYVHKPEQFLIEYKTRPKDETNELKQLYVKGELYTNKKLGISPSVFKYDILFF